MNLPATVKQAHPLADLFPLIKDSAFRALCDDIRERGLLDPIVLHSDLVLDGRNRLRACNETGVQPRFVEFDSLKLKVTPEQFVWSKNIRRDLSEDQRSAIAIQWKERIAADAKERLREAGKQGGQIAGKGRPKDRPPAKTPEAYSNGRDRSGETRHKLAETANVSEHKIRVAEQVAEHCPHLLPKVASGELKLSEAKRSTDEVRRSKGESKPRAPRKKHVPDLDASSIAMRIFARVKSDISEVPKEKHERLLIMLKRLMETLWTQKS